MEIQKLAIEKLIPYIRNPRKNENAVEKVTSSIHEFGFRQPIVVDAENVIIAGHTRFEAAKRLGMNTVPVHVAKGLTEQQVKAYRIADNRVAQDSEWDFNLLSLEIEEIEKRDILGFSDEEIKEILGEVDYLNEMPDLAEGEKVPFQQMTFILHEEQAEQVKMALEKAKKQGAFHSPNENSNGNALARVCESFNGFS